MASGPFVEMQPGDCEYNKITRDKRPLIPFVPLEPLLWNHIKKAIYILSSKKDSTFDVQLFDETGECKDLICWWNSFEKYISLTQVMDFVEKFEAILGFLADGEAVQDQWGKCKEGASLVEVSTSHPNSFHTLGTTSETAFKQAVFRYFAHYIEEETCADQRWYLQRSICKT